MHRKMLIIALTRHVCLEIPSLFTIILIVISWATNSACGTK